MILVLNMSMKLLSVLVVNVKTLLINQLNDLGFINHEDYTSSKEVIGKSAAGYPSSCDTNNLLV